MIPKIIHFIWWQGRTQIPAHYQKNMQIWQSQNPTYQIKFWDENSLNQLVATHFSAYQRNWSRSKWFIEKIDLAKFMLMIVYGGFYIDVDVEPLRPIPDDLLPYQMVVSKVYLGDVCPETGFCILPLVLSFSFSCEDVFNNGFFGGAAGSLMYQDLLKYAMRMRTVIPRWIGKCAYVCATAGPIFLSLYLKLNDLKNHPQVKLLSPHVIEGCGLNYTFTRQESCCHLTDLTIGIHKHGFSWTSPLVMFILQCIFHRKKLFHHLVIGLLVGSIIILGWLLWNTGRGFSF